MKIVESIFSSNMKTTTKRIKLLIADCIISMEVRRMRPKPKMNPLDKRIKPNPKYSKVASSCFYPHMLCCYNFPERWNLQ